MNTIRTTKKWKWILAACLIGALSLVALTGCGNSSKSSGSKGSESSESKITIAGSTSVQPLSEVLAEQYSKDHSDVKIDVQGGGSGQAAKSLEEGIAQIGALSREVESEEKKTIKNEYTIAMDGVAIVVNKNVGVDQLSIKQLRKIYTGDITNWKNVGGKDATIAVISREEGSGTRGAFTEITGVLEKDKKGNETDNTVKDAIIQSSTGSVIKTVSSTPNAIGYVSLEAVDDSVKAVRVEGVDCTAATIKDKSYPISRPFIYAVGDKVDSTTQEYLDWVMSDEGQAQVKKAGFIPVN